MTRKQISLKYIFPLVAVAVLAIGAIYVFKHDATPKESVSYTAAHDRTFDRHQFSTTDPNSIWLIVNKHKPLQPVAYAPPDLTTPHFLLTENPENSEMKVRKEVAEAMGKLYDAGHKQNVDLLLSSGYRSYQEQKETRDELKQEKGPEQADRESARNGYSEHQTGLAADVGVKGADCLVEQCFANTTAGKWLASNAYKYGFILRYPDGKESVTGYEYEPWHIRYVGVALATEMHQKKISTLEEFFDTGAAPDYK